MARWPKRVNKHFFDKESKEMYYVLGIAYPKAVYSYDDDLIFRSPDRKLMENLKRLLGSDHAITKNNYSYQMQIRSATLCSKLQDLGVKREKKDRAFPEFIPEDLIDQFSRGFVDAKAAVSPGSIGINFNNVFLNGLNDALKKYANTQRDGTNRDYIFYSGVDSSRIHDFLYKDWEYIRDKKLYLPSKKKLFVHFEYKTGENNRIKCLKNIEKGKKLLIRGKKASVVALELGYEHEESFLRAFKHVTGQTTRSFLRELRAI